MSLDAKRCAELLALNNQLRGISGKREDGLADALRDALSLLSECRKLAYNLQNEHPAMADLLDKLNEAGVE